MSDLDYDELRRAASGDWTATVEMDAVLLLRLLDLAQRAEAAEASLERWEAAIHDYENRAFAAEHRARTAEAAVERVRALADEWESTWPAWVDPVDGPLRELRAALDRKEDQ